MKLLPTNGDSPFEYNFFISHRHDGLEGWTKAFVNNHLVKEINLQFSSACRFAFDGERRSSSDPTLAWTHRKSLLGAAERSAVLLVVLSKYYRMSDPCRREREKWLAFQRKQGLEPTDNIILLDIQNVSRDKYPSEFMTLKGTPVGSIRCFNEYDHPLGWEVRDGTLNECDREKINAVCMEISTALQHKFLNINQKLSKKKAHLRTNYANIFRELLDSIKVPYSSMRTYFHKMGGPALPQSIDEVSIYHLSRLLVIEQLIYSGQIDRCAFEPQSQLNTAPTRTTPHASIPQASTPSPPDKYHPTKLERYPTMDQLLKNEILLWQGKEEEEDN